MAGTWGYTESTNIVVVTGGTSGAPATFADFVTADRAGVDTSLLSGGSPASNLALTYAVRPVEDLAILVKCIVANKTAEADFIFITGTDWRGAAQTESIDVTAGNGSYTSTKYWATITTLDCSDNAAGGGVVWADGDLSVTQDVWGVIWDHGGGQHQIDAILEWGNGSTATHFASENESLHFRAAIESKANATIRFGDYNSGRTKHGSYIRLAYAQASWGGMAGVHEFYASIIETVVNAQWHNFSSTVKIDGLTIFGRRVSDDYLVFYVSSANSGGFIKNLRTIDAYYGILQNPLGATVSNVTAQNCYYGIRISAPGPSTCTFANTVIEGAIANDLALDWVTNKTLNFINSSLDFTAITWGGNHTGCNVYEQYTSDIHIADKDGVNLSGVTVLCEDKDDAQVFSVSTAADGTITQQTISVNRYYNDGSAQSVTYNDHKFTFSKAGYETLVLENVTVDGPIDCHFELQQQKQSPAPWQEGVM